MYTIGDISKIVNVSSNTLRYYDEIGLLKPSMVQSNNQYRYYSETQIKEISYILELKQYGCSLDEIRILLRDKSNQTLIAVLSEKRIEMMKEIERLREQYIFLERRISKITEEEELEMKGRKVLIVDDLALARKMIRNIIEDYGYKVVGEAANGKEAVAAYDELHPDLVIMDIIMPGMDGIDATKEIKRKYKNARIIICSAMSQANVVFEGIKAGAKDYTLKPISSIRLIEALENGLNDNPGFEHVYNLISMIKNRLEGKSLHKTLKQEEIDLLLFNSINEREQDEAVNNIFSKVGLDSSNENKCDASGPYAVEEKTITFLTDKFSELSVGFSDYISNRFNYICTMKLMEVENITIGEFRSLLKPDSDIVTIEYNASSVPIHIHALGEFANKKELLKECYKFIDDNLERIVTYFKERYMVIRFYMNRELENNYSTILISYSIEFSNQDKGFLMLSIPHNSRMFEK